MNHPSNSDDRFNDRQEALRTENEILKLKMLAETGGTLGGCHNLPPELENLFLQHVQSFENAYRNARQVKVFDLLGQPSFKKESEMNDVELDLELYYLVELMAQHRILFRLMDDNDPRTIYRLITEELFDLEVSDVNIPGMMMSFHYECPQKKNSKKKK